MVLVFLIPALADDHREPKASPPPEDFAAGWIPDVEDDWDCGVGAWTEVK